MGKHPNLSQFSADSEGQTLVEKTLGQLLFEAAERAPNAEAVVYPGLLRWTWSALLDRALKLAHGLQSLGISRGEHVAVFAPNVPDWITLQWAAALQDLVLVTVNPTYREEELAYVLAQSDSVALFYEPELRGRSQTAIVEAAQRRGLPRLRKVVRFSDVESLLTQRSQATLAANDSAVCMIQYTSGTTGFPKGAMLTHRGLVNNVFAIGRRRGDRPGERIAHGMPFFHTGGCVLQTVQSAAMLTTQVPLVLFDPIAALRALAEERASQFGGVPTMLQVMIDHPQQKEFDLSAVRMVTMGGSPVPIDLAIRLQSEFGWQVAIVFGQTEASPVITQTIPTDSPERSAGTVGYALPHLDVKIIDPASGQTVPTGETGEICVRGYSVMKGYYQRAESPIDEDDFLHTGDLARMDEHGYVNIVGRIKDLVIRGGENIYPVEVESVLRSHPAVLDVQVVGVPDLRYGEELCAAIRLRGEIVSKETILQKIEPELRELIDARLARYKMPRYFCAVAEFPMTASGKVQKFKLREQLMKDLGIESAARPTA